MLVCFVLHYDHPKILKLSFYVSNKDSDRSQIDFRIKLYKEFNLRRHRIKKTKQK